MASLETSDAVLSFQLIKEALLSCNLFCVISPVSFCNFFFEGRGSPVNRTITRTDSFAMFANPRKINRELKEEK